MRYWLVVPAAGSGSRFGAATPKQYAPLAGRTVIEWALAPFFSDGRCAQLVVALASGDVGWARVAARLGVRDVGRVITVVGGERRSQSVRNALAALASQAAANDWVMVHDAARPCLDLTDLGRLVSELQDDNLGGILAVPAADTLKRAIGTTGMSITETVDRSGLWRALTPQMFRYGALCTALDAAHAAGRYPTDEAQALEWQGERPRLIEGMASNLKVTTGADLVLAAAMLGARAA